jgi:hypothetical protein
MAAATPAKTAIALTSPAEIYLAICPTNQAIIGQKTVKTNVQRKAVKIIRE